MTERDKERRRQYMREYYLKNKSRMIANVAKWQNRPENIEKVKAWKARWWKGHWADHAVELYARHEQWRKSNGFSCWVRDTIKSIIEKLSLLDAYGGECSCCRERGFEFLTVDHIDGDGNKLRRDGEPIGRRLYRKLRLAGYPKDRYRLLCMNCNFAYGKYGYCPHQFEQQEYGLSGC